MKSVPILGEEKGNIMKAEQKAGLTKKQVAYEGIKEMVISGLPAGTPLVERDLCEKLEVSRTPVREALRQLASEGLVDMMEGKGVFVAKIRFEDMVEIFELREVLESLAVRLFVQRRETALVDMLNELMVRQEKAYEQDDHTALMDCDMEFHELIAKGSRNKRLYDMIVSIYNQVRQMAISVQDDQKVRDLAVRSHRLIMDAILKSDAEEAAKFMEQHIAETKQYHIERYYML